MWSVWEQVARVLPAFDLCTAVLRSCCLWGMTVHIFSEELVPFLVSLRCALDS